MDWTLQIDNQNQSFKDKQNDLFAELDKVKTALPNERYTDHADRPERDANKRSAMKTYKGKNSIFKRPEAPLRKCLPSRRKPDYQVNPRKWTKYSLNDVTADDMSERANKTAALSFLKELEKRKESERKRGERISFQHSAMVTVEQGDEEQKSTFQNSKRVMPEYVVGQKVKKERRSCGKGGTSNQKELALSHLMQDDEADDGNT